MGGTSIAQRSKYFINYSNPASYSVFDSTSFVFDVAVYSKFSTFLTTDIKQEANYTSLGYLTLGFPVARHWRTSLGVIPYSNVGYIVKFDSTYENIGTASFENTGTGGLNKIYWGNGFSISKHLSLGFNLTYVFGTIDKDKAVLIQADTALNSKVVNNTQVGGFLTDLGLQYQWNLKNNYFLTLGLVYSPSLDLNAKSNDLSYTFLRNASTGVDNILDTVYYSPNTKGTIKIPQKLGFGANYGKINQWDIGIDAQWQDWSKYRYYGESNDLQNSLRVSIGGRFMPTAGFGSYIRRLNYRAGVRFEKSYLYLNDKSINNFGVSFGIGFPLPKLSSLNVGFEYGSGGTMANNLIKENFFRISLGVSFYDRWFLKQRYD